MFHRANNGLYTCIYRVNSGKFGRCISLVIEFRNFIFFYDQSKDGSYLDKNIILHVFSIWGDLTVQDQLQEQTGELMDV